jgi:hypothetical protein
VSRRSAEARIGSQRKNGIKEHTGSWQGFVDLPLLDADKERLAALSDEDYPNLATFLTEVLQDGYKFSAVTDEAHHCVIATLTGKSEGCVNAGFSLSARGPDLAGAILVLHYKHTVLCEGQRWAGHEDSRNTQLSLWG